MNRKPGRTVLRHRPSVRSDIYTFVQHHGDVTAGQIVAALAARKPATVRVELACMVAAGEILRIGEHGYSRYHIGPVRPTEATPGAVAMLI